MKETGTINFDLRGKKLLVVEDDPIFGLILKSIFKTWKNTVTEFAVNGKEALEKLLQPGFDLVLMDLQMPIMDGYQATRAIRSGDVGRVYSHIPIIAVTADLSSEAQSRGCTVGFNDFLIKPTDNASLFATIACYLLEKSTLPENGQLGNPYTMTGYHYQKR